MDLNEARKNLEVVLGDELMKQYFDNLRQWFLFNPTLTKDQFDQNVRKLFYNEDQTACHNQFLLALISKASSNNKPKNIRQVSDKGVFETADFADYVQPISPNRVLPSNYEYRSAAAELFTPDNGFIACRIAVAAWENGMDGADNGVTELIVHACQTFLKNIITAMVTKVKSYKIRDGKFQYGFNMPVPDPYIRNYNNVTDESMQSKVRFEEDILLPKCKMSLERAEQEVAYAYAATKKIKTGVTLNTKLLYETIRNNPDLLGLHSIQSTNVLKLGLYSGDNDESFSEDEDLEV